MATHVFWDWNGTLCDDVLLALEAVNEMLRKRSRTPITLADYYSYIGIPIRRFYEHVFDLNEVPMEVISVEYNTYYDAHLREDCLMPGARETLSVLRDAGVKQYILTSSHKESVLPTVKKLGLLPFFDAVLGADDWHVQSKEDRARSFCEANGLWGESLWFVGDMLHDRDTANACGGSCLLIPGGHQSEEALRGAGNCFCPSIAEVPARICMNAGK
ncbi:MAG: HAD family hydrolase [Oscillospiraceae bacterium]|nr:HAD family hydrolase [Oscillospiraceae bacterium]